MITVAMGVGALSAVGFAGYAYLAHNAAVTANAAAWRDSAAVDAQRAAARKAAAERAAAQQKYVDAALAAHMISVPGAGEPLTMFYRFEDGGECGPFSTCSWVTVMTVRDCPGGVYFAANVVSSGVVVASGNKITGGLRAGEPATFRVDYPGGPTDGRGEVEVTSVHCL